MVLLPKPLRPGVMEKQLVHALPDVWVRVGEEVGRDAFVSRRPCGPAVIRPERTPAGQVDVHPLRVTRVELDRVRSEAAGAREPLVARRVLEKPLVRLPVLAPIVRAE